MLRAACCVLLIACCLLVVSCAKTVTQIVTYGDQMAVEITLRGTMEPNANRYFLVLASNSNYKIPLPSPDVLDSAPEFIEPGMTPFLGSPEAYYTNFYSTWAGYVVVGPEGFSLMKGPFIQNQPITYESSANLGEISTKIKFNFELSRIFGAAVPSTIYFDFISVPWPTDAAKIPADHLTSTNACISKIAGSTVTISDEQNDNLDPARDILSCTVTIQ